MRMEYMKNLRKLQSIAAEPKTYEPMLIADVLNTLAKEIRKKNEKWWRDPYTGEKLNRNRPEMFMLMVSEIAEAMEGYRKNLMDDHLPKYKMETVELADLFIRLMDLVGEDHPDFGQAVVDKLAYNETRKDHTAEARLQEHGKRF